MDPLDPTFGPYVLQKRLGVGGMAEAFLALRRGPAGFEQRVCLKRVLPALNVDSTFREQFILEARIAAMLRHSNIVGVIDFGEHQGTYYLAMELVDGVDLRTLLQGMSGRLPPELVVLVAHDLARALSYAHEAREGRPAIVHRDISPSNLLLNNDGDLKLADFGIAKAMHTAGATASNVVKGKIQYMAPEQMMGAPVDGRADLFALGVLMYEALAGRRPFDGQTDVDTMRRVIDGVRRPLMEAAPEAPPELVTLVEQLLATHPEQRPAHAGLVLDHLPVVTAGARKRMAAEVQRARAVSGSPLDSPGVRGGGTEKVPPPARTPSAPSAVAAAPTVTRPSAARRSRTPLIVLATALSIGVGVAALAVLKKAQPTEPSAKQAAVAVVPPPPGPPSAPATAPQPQAPASPTPAGAPVQQTPPPASPAAEAVKDLPKDEPKPSREERRATRHAQQDRTTDPESPKRGGGAEKSGDAAADRATVRIVVIPWGEVWIDGRYMGRAPTDVVVNAGEHTLGVGQGNAQRSQRITVKAGERRTFELELD